MEVIAINLDGSEFSVSNFDTLGVGVRSMAAYTFKPLLVVVAAIKLTMTS